jgi:hypothetical protein
MLKRLDDAGGVAFSVNLNLPSDETSVRQQQRTNKSTKKIGPKLIPVKRAPPPPPAKKAVPAPPAKKAVPPPQAKKSLPPPQAKKALPPPQDKKAVPSAKKAGVPPPQAKKPFSAPSAKKVGVPPPPPSAKNSGVTPAEKVAVRPAALPLKTTPVNPPKKAAQRQRTKKLHTVSPKKKDEACMRLHETSELTGELKEMYAQGKEAAHGSLDAARDHEIWLLSRRVKVKKSLSAPDKEKEKLAKALVLLSSQNKAESMAPQYAPSSALLNLVDRLLPSIEEDASSEAVTLRLQKALLAKPNKNLRNERQNGKLLLFGSALSMWSLSTTINKTAEDDDITDDSGGGRSMPMVLRDLDYCLVLPDAEGISATQRKRLVFVIKAALERAGFLNCIAIHRARVPVRLETCLASNTIYHQSSVRAGCEDG